MYGMNPALARAIATRRGPEHSRGAMPRSRSPYRARRIIEFCRAVDRNRTELAELAQLSPVAARFYAATVRRAALEFRLFAADERRNWRPVGR